MINPHGINNSLRELHKRLKELGWNQWDIENYKYNVTYENQKRALVENLINIRDYWYPDGWEDYLKRVKLEKLQSGITFDTPQKVVLATGFKVHFQHLRKHYSAFQEVCKEYNATVINLVRRNKLEVHLSKEISDGRGIADAESDVSDPKQLKGFGERSFEQAQKQKKLKVNVDIERFQAIAGE